MRKKYLKLMPHFCQLLTFWVLHYPVNLNISKDMSKKTDFFRLFFGPRRVPGGPDGVKSGGKWFRNIFSHIWSPYTPTLDHFRVIFGSFWAYFGPFLGCFWPKMDQKWGVRGPKRGPRGSKMGPKWPKNDQEHCRNTLKHFYSWPILTPRWPIFGHFSAPPPSQAGDHDPGPCLVKLLNFRGVQHRPGDT